MEGLRIASDFAERADKISSLEGLGALIEDTATRLGFRYFALGHHADPGVDRKDAVVVHNYPSAWARYFRENRLYETDPVVRISERTNTGFLWSALPCLTEMTNRDLEILECAREEGVADGFTVPFHMPGELPGSFSFATPVEQRIDRERLLLAQLVGSFAFEAARRVNRQSSGVGGQTEVRLTERQRECLVLAARGKTDWEIARILGISPETVTLHLKGARDRYGVTKRLPLAVRALYDGQISFSEIL